MQICAFALGPRVAVQLCKYTKDAGIVYDPPSSMARIEIKGAPPSYWNESYFNTIVSSFGSLVRMSPMIEGKFNKICLLVDCHHLINIPKYMSSTTIPYSTTCEIKLEGWLHATEANIYCDLSDAFPIGPPHQREQAQ